MSLPTEVIFNGIEIQLLTFQQLEQLSRQNLKLRVKTLQEQLEGQQLPPCMGHSPDVTIDWILKVQCAICMGKGVRLSPADFGAPANADSEGFFGRGEAMPQSAKAKGDQWSHSNDMRAPMGNHNGQGSNDVYADAMATAAAAKQRNMGSNIFG